MPGEETLPDGVRDYVGKDARLHRHLEESLARSFQGWNYDEIITPCLELYEQLYPGVGRRMLRRSYKMTDWRGRILTLRPEMTTPIARAAATLLVGEPGPHRLYYMARVFRIPPSGEGWLSEFTQAGGELLGVAGAPGDAEAIALALESLEDLGLPDLHVAVGHMAFLRSVLRHLDLDEAAEDSIIDCLRERNLVQLEQVLSETSLPPRRQDYLWELVTHSGNGDTRDLMEKMARKLGRDALPELENLQELFQLLDSFGLASKVYLDLGLVRSLDYYTGVIFEIYGPGLGRPVGGGGRYDGLLHRFGLDLPATGFALGFPELMALYQHQKLPEPEPARNWLVSAPPSRREAAVTRARELRGQELVVELDLQGRPREDCQKYARRCGLERVLLLSPDGGEEVLCLEKVNPTEGGT